MAGSPCPPSSSSCCALSIACVSLAVAEDRDLLHAPGTLARAKELYADNYGFGYLRDRSSRRAAHDHHHDAWEGVKIVFRALERGEKLLGLPALGSLFAMLALPPSR